MNDINDFGNKSIYLTHGSDWNEHEKPEIT